KQNVIVAGSTWADDDKILSAYAKQNESVALIIAPHDIKQKRIGECLQLYPSAITLSDWNKLSEEENNNFKTLIINNIGMLAQLYYYGSICYVGGGFTRDGVHNVLEAAVYNKPVVIGPEYDKYTEVKKLIAEQGGESIKTAEELKLVCDDLFANNTKRLTTGWNAGNYVRSKTGATDKILSFIQKNRLLTN
ncbi:MAG: lipid 3-deoxy-D-manno-octulosonic acid transferase, partial [Chitinophagaceae bacterium]|nr:lipid 3-deoxy-D-manno-octulosonic acid transferase [Chitinophagaceae bacterium]